MFRSNKHFSLTFLTFLLTFSLFLTPSHAEDEVKITTTTVTDQISLLSGKGGNIGLFIGKDGTFIIDDQFAPLTEKILAAIHIAGGTTPKFLINTHFHADHSGGNENLGNKGTLIFSHHSVRERLAKGSMIKAFGMESPPAAKAALPVVTFSNDMHFHLNGDTVKAIHTPNAHTDGDSYIHFKYANVIHTGDLFFNGFYPFIDADHGGSMKGAIAAVDAILAISDTDTKIIPGHGPLADKADLQAYRDMLSTAYKALLRLKNAGLTATEAALGRPLRKLDKQWADGMFSSERWIHLIYPAIH